MSPLTERETLLAMRQDTGKDKCEHCPRFIGGCEVHDRDMQEELACYFDRQTGFSPTHSGERIVAYMAGVSWDSNDEFNAYLEDTLSSRLVAFRNNYGKLLRYKEERDHVMGHGKLAITFDADTFHSDCAPYESDRYHVVHTGSPYFAMGAVFGTDRWGDHFCCLFEDGKYFYCVSVNVRDEEENEETDFIGELNRMVAMITENQFRRAARCQLPLPA